MKYFNNLSYKQIVPNKNLNFCDFHEKVAESNFRKYSLCLLLTGAGLGFVGGYISSKVQDLETKIEQVTQ